MIILKIQKFIFFSVLLALIFISGAASSQPEETENKKKDMEGKSVRFLPLPYLGYNESIGFQYGVLPIFMLDLNKLDTISPPSSVGGFGMHTTTKSWIVLGFGRFYLKEDTWRLKGGFGKGNFNFQFYISPPFDIYVPYNTNANFAVFHVERKIINDLYGGLGYKFTAFDTSLDSLNYSERTELHGISISLSFDGRSSVYYPRTGIYANANYDLFPEWLGNDKSSSALDLDYNQYFSIRSDKDVLAARFYSAVGIGDLSFNEQQFVGNDDLRGYMDGKYRGKTVLAMQGEYRWNFYKGLGAVGFAGVATVLGANNEDHEGKLLPSVGTGLRYKLMGEMISIGFDVAAGIDDWGLYFRISEAF